MENREILLEEAIPGMTIAKDIYSDRAGLIIGKNTVLTARGITRLKIYGIRRITIVIARKNISSGEQKSKDEFRIIKETKEFKKFKYEFKETVQTVKDKFNSIVLKNEEIQENELLKEAEILLDQSNNGIHMLEMIQGMRDADDLTYIHSLNVSLICNVFGNWLKMSKEDIRILTMSGLLHDLGKLMIPVEVLNKPEKLTSNEYSIMKEHPRFGYNILKDKDLDERVKIAVLTHHERNDGSGYPNGISGNKISEIAKVLAIADVYEAMTARRIYRDEISPFEVISMFEEEGLKKYDPAYIIPLLEMIVQSYIGNNVQLSNQQIGEVIMVNKGSLSRPVVRIENEFLDLSKTKDIRIEKVV